MKITSSNNKWIKDVKKFKTKKGRRQNGVFVAEGLRFLRSLLELGAEIEVVLYSDELVGDEYRQNVPSINFPIIEVSADVLNPLFETETPQGIIAVVKQPSWSFEDLLKDKKPIMILDRLQDPGNLGTIIRTADCAGLGGIVMLKGCVDMYNDKVLRSTMGAIATVPILEGLSWSETKQNLLNQGYDIFSAEVSSNRYYDEVDYSLPSAVIIGNEANGIAQDICDDKSVSSITIPNMGQMESLNASVAGAVIMYEMLRQRRGQ